MSFHNDNQNVRTCAGIVLWDGITQPDTDQTTGQVTHSIKIAIPENAPEKVELEQLATNVLNTSEFKGQFPAGGSWPIMPIDMSKFGDSTVLLQGRVAINAKTRIGVPKVFDANGQELAPMQFSQMLYPGAVVELLVHAYAFNNRSKGLAYGLDGIMIVDATAPKLDIGGGMSAQAVAAAFGGGGAQQPAGMSPGAQQPADMPPGAQQPAGMPPGAQQPAGMPPGAQQPAGMPPGAQQPAGMPPVTPHPGFVQNAGKVMTAKANGATYEQFVAQGWTDEMMIREGYLQG